MYSCSFPNHDIKKNSSDSLFFDCSLKKIKKKKKI